MTARYVTLYAAVVEFLRLLSRAGLRVPVDRCPKCGEPGYLYAHPRKNRIYVRHYDYHDIGADTTHYVSAAELPALLRELEDYARELCMAACSLLRLASGTASWECVSQN